MGEAKEILGYTRKGEPIYELERGMIATAASVSCYKCHKYIRGMGGPLYGAMCVECFEGNSNG